MPLAFFRLGPSPQAEDLWLRDGIPPLDGDSHTVVSDTSTSQSFSYTGHDLFALPSPATTDPSPLLDDLASLPSFSTTSSTTSLELAALYDTLSRVQSHMPFADSNKKPFMASSRSYSCFSPSSYKAPDFCLSCARNRLRFS